MSGPETETLTAALRRLADERATGLLSVATPGRDVVVELADGQPVAIGPVHDVGDRLGDDAPDGLTAVAVVDDLVDRTVAAIVGSEGDWAWDVASDAERLPVPAGLVDELARRAVDAAQAMAVIQPEDVLLPGHEVETSGELDRVRRLYDGERSMEDVAEAADLTVPAVATMTAALVAAGALAVDGDEDDEQPVSWTDAVRASDDDDDDEPELWVMEPAEDESEDEPEQEEDAAEPERGLFFGTPADDEPDASEGPVAPDPLDEAPPAPAPPPPPPVTEHEQEAPAPAADVQAVPTAATSEDDGWNDTAWLDELSPQDEAEDAPPVLAAGDEEPADARAALSSMLQDLQSDEPPSKAPADEPEPARDDAAEAATTETGTEALATERREPRAEPGEVTEFLRELSRLALDDD